MSNYDNAEGIRRSDLWLINKSPMHFKYKMDTGREPTPALQFGAAVHSFILEPDMFDQTYVVAPEVNRRTKAGREDWESFVQLCEDNERQIITREDLIKIQDMAAALEENALAGVLLSGKHEQEYYWTDDLTGEKCKCKVDCVTEYEGKPYIVDYKTTDSCEDGHFERAARKYGYQFQAGMYCEGLFQNTFDVHGFAFVAQEKTAPYASRVYICSEDWIKRGYDTFRELIGIYHYCKQTGDWYGYEGMDGLPVDLMEV